jgi:hypothetical protein
MWVWGCCLGKEEFAVGTTIHRGKGTNAPNEIQPVWSGFSRAVLSRRCDRNGILVLMQGKT